MSKFSNADECIKEMDVQFKGTSESAFEGLKAVGQSIVSGAQKNLKKNKTTAFGQLSASGSTYADSVSKTVEAGFTARHAPFVEFGRKSGRMPKIEVLKAWVRRKLRVKEKEVNSVTFAVARKIAREGTRAQPFLRPAYEDVQKKIESIMKKYAK